MKVSMRFCESMVGIKRRPYQRVVTGVKTGVVGHVPGRSFRSRVDALGLLGRCRWNGEWRVRFRFEIELTPFANSTGLRLVPSPFHISHLS
jgi:hypothetical protein